MIMADIDQFNEINDSYGHAAGDMALREFTRRLSAILRQSDYFGRYGGEEFLILVGDTNQAAGDAGCGAFPFGYCRLAVRPRRRKPARSPPASALRSLQAPPSPRRPSLRQPTGLSPPPRPADGTGASLPDPLRR